MILFPFYLIRQGACSFGCVEEDRMNIQLMEYYREVKGCTYDKISKLSGIPVETVRGILSGEELPGEEVRQALEDVLMPGSAFGLREGGRYPEGGAKGFPDMLGESKMAYQAGSYTLEDYYALPDERRVELIDGAFYDMSAPSTGHQRSLLRIVRAIDRFIEGRSGECEVFMAPVDVQLDCDDRTMVQPDILIVCDKDKITEKCIVGAPDFIIEILSRSTEKKDMFLKFRKYKNAGVREYWIVDTKRRKVIVYFFERDQQPAIYGLSDRIPVGIYNGELVIDFAQIEGERRVEYPDQGTVVEGFPDMLGESETAYQAGKGIYTLEDYYALPDERRVELIDGVFYDMSAPSTGHQTAVVQISVQINDFLRRKKGGCRGFAAPVDVQLDCDDRTMVQPDILIVCDKDKITEKCIVGAPDFIIEILSRSTEKKDLFLKFRKYKNAGVREYWIVDTKRRKVIVYFFERDQQPAIYGLSDRVPAGIYDGELVIDFAQVEEELEYIGQ